MCLTDTNTNNDYCKRNQSLMPAPGCALLSVRTHASVALRSITAKQQPPRLALCPLHALLTNLRCSSPWACCLPSALGVGSLYPPLPISAITRASCRAHSSSPPAPQRKQQAWQGLAPLMHPQVVPHIRLTPVSLPSHTP